MLQFSQNWIEVNRREIIGGSTLPRTSPCVCVQNRKRRCTWILRRTWYRARWLLVLDGITRRLYGNLYRVAKDRRHRSHPITVGYDFCCFLAIMSASRWYKVVASRPMPPVHSGENRRCKNTVFDFADTLIIYTPFALTFRVSCI